MRENSAIPIIVIGMNRSGTRWLTALLTCHRDIAGVRVINEENPGALALETNMFSIFPQMYGNISILNKYIAMVEQWATTQYFKSMELEKRDLYELNPRPENCYTLFTDAMNLYAEREGSPYWVQKTTPRCYRDVVNHIPKAKFIAIKRDIITNLRSKLKREVIDLKKRKFNIFDLMRLTFLYISDEWVIRKMEKNSRIDSFSVCYEDLAKDNEKELKRICDYLSIPFDASILEISLYRNTRFTGKDKKEEFFSRADKFMVKLFRFLFRMFPGQFMWLLRDKFGKKGNSDYINDTFRYIKQQYGIYE